MSIAKAKEVPGLRLSVSGTKLDLSVLFRAEGNSRGSNLQKSDSGKGVRFKNVCAEHHEPVKQPKVCEKCGGPPPAMLKGYDMGGGEMVYLEPEEVIKPSGVDEVEILYFVDVAEVGWGFAPELANLMGKVLALVPNTTTKGAKATLQRWAALLAMLHGNAAIARVTDDDSFFYAVLVATPGGAVLAYQMALPEHVYGIPEVEEVPELPPEQWEAFVGRAEELRRPFKREDVAHNPYLEATYAAISARSNGEKPKAKAAAAAPAPMEDLRALI